MSDPRIAGLHSAALTDAMGRRHEHVAHILDWVTPTPGRVLFGPAATVQYMPYRADLHDSVHHNFARKFYEALSGDGTGKVLVMSSGGHPGASMGGGIKMSRPQNQALAGVLIDGRLRDFHELAEYDFAAYCRGETVRWGGDTIMPWAADVAVQVGGVTIHPGDYVFADSAAAVIIPAADLEWVLAEAHKIDASDAGWIVKIKAEDPAEVLARGSQEA